MPNSFQTNLSQRFVVEVFTLLDIFWDYDDIIVTIDTPWLLSRPGLVFSR